MCRELAREDLCDKPHKSQDIRDHGTYSFDFEKTQGVAHQGGEKDKGGTGRRRTPTDSDDEEDPVVTPYKWSTSTTRVKQTKGGPSTISTRAAAVTADTDG